jgi:hypothetical protein
MAAASPADDMMLANGLAHAAGVPVGVLAGVSGDEDRSTAARAEAPCGDALSDWPAARTTGWTHR